MSERAYTVVVTRTRAVEVCASSWGEAKIAVEEMYLSGDACAELNDATYNSGGIRDFDEDGNLPDE